jgi:hypothetical protein
MTTLSGLKLTTAQKQTHINPVQQRRNKLVKRLWEQAELARALTAGTQYVPTKLRTVLDNETGLRKQVQVNKRVKQWWFTAESGKLCLQVRYGVRVLELAKGKYAVEVGAEKDLVATLDVIKAAVIAGELDAAMETASTKLRAGFGK